MSGSENNKQEIVHVNGKITGKWNHIIKERVEFDSGLGSLWKFWKRRRYIVAVLSFFGFFVMFCLRVNFSVAIVAMTANRSYSENGRIVYVQDFDWDTKLQGFLLGSFYYGYLVTQLPGGWLSDIFGGHHVFGIGIALSACATMFSSLAAGYSPYLLASLKIMEGLFHGITTPAFSSLIAQWTPPVERSRLSSIGLAGCYAGTVVCFPLSGVIAEYLNWPSIFYVTGTMGILWFAIWCLVVRRSPEHDTNISEEELKYIVSSLEQEEGNKIQFRPWKKILTSVPVWANITAAIVQNWGFFTFITQLPMFMEGAFHYSIEDAGYISSFPYLVMALSIQLSGYFSDLLQSRQIVSKTMMRKLVICVPFTWQMILVLLAGILETPVGILACLTVAVTLESFTWGAICVNHLDLSSQNAGIIMGLVMTVSTLPGILSPMVTGLVVHNKTKSEWQVVFFIAGALYLFGIVVFGIFGTGEKQNWTDNENKTTDGVFTISVKKYDVEKRNN